MNCLKKYRKNANNMRAVVKHNMNHKVKNKIKYHKYMETT